MAEVAIQGEEAGKIRMESEDQATLENDSDSGHSD
jgi:hypothetical protein